MGEKKAKGIIVAAIIWIAIIGILSVAAKYLILPYFDKELAEETGSDSHFKNEVRIAADSFSGYCILRSPAMKNQLKNDGIKLTIVDDNADYGARMKSLDKKDVEMAVFTIDSFILNGARLDRFPASIVMVIDESKGADAIVAYKSAISSIQDLDDPEAAIVLTPDSPSEFLARTVIAHFNLPQLPDKWMIRGDGAREVFSEFNRANHAKKRAYALWEPYVSKALQIKDAHLLIDSSKLKGYIVDVLVAERFFLKEHPDLVQRIIESYLRAAYSYDQSDDGMRDLIIEDARATGSESIDADMAEKMAQRIEWKNTLENYAYFGIDSSQGTSGIQNIEEMLDNITDVLVKTGTLAENPFKNKTHTLYYDKILNILKTANFHPGKKVNVVEGLGLGTGELEKVHSQSPLRPISDAEWKALIPVGSLRIDPISFARGTARINLQSQRDLHDLSRRLSNWPEYYLRVIGHARADGNMDENMKLAGERADAAAKQLIAAGVSTDRIRAESDPPTEKEGSSQSVSFILGQLPY
ncbi:MAG: phosphate ABC transporter substrate-binding/OmpA family protein [Desulfosalsimonadaceae bacterium]|nr:phosphate ABC transporter substrate-binding/OmpA family protein [Desulfosalsimonadaceae bacterium]